MITYCTDIKKSGTDNSRDCYTLIFADLLDDVIIDQETQKVDPVPVIRNSKGCNTISSRESSIRLYNLIDNHELIENV
ncbi:hypothetical protein [Kiloniella majae]|uniref:hypothetical protein n=1 Tax=Kiloniella majae TaxID=1938558 RepID=UPI000A277688|nr:hypothetical protein [Kiloniella majae]